LESAFDKEISVHSDSSMDSDEEYKL